MLDGIEEVPLTINRVNPNDVLPTHVNDLIVTNDGNEFYLIFSEIEPPFIFDEEELKRLRSIDANIKIKLVISPSFAEAILNTLNENVEKLKIIKNRGK